MKDEIQEWNAESPSQHRECSICCAPSSGHHFNAPSCSACAAFFRRTVTLDRKFHCAGNGNCTVEYTMRVICRACRYKKCINAGMDRRAVQPRRDTNFGRRKILQLPKQNIHINEFPSNSLQHNHQTSPLQPVMETCGLEIPQPGQLPPQCPSGSGSTSSSGYGSTTFFDDTSGQIPPTSSQQWSPMFSTSLPSPPIESAVDDLLKEERLYNERRKILYCGRSPISTLLTASEVDDIPFSVDDTQELTFSGIRKDIRAQILLTYEWIRGWKHFGNLNLRDKKTFLRRCILYHTILDPAYLTYRLGYPDRFIMFNGLYVGVDENSEVGWQSEKDVISAELKNELYRPLMERVQNEIVIPMTQIKLTYTEYVVLKGLVSFKSASVYDIDPSTRAMTNSQIDAVLHGLHLHYQQIGMGEQEIAERTGNLVLLMSGIFAVSMECLESHQKIQFFDLWELDDLLLQLLTRDAGRNSQRKKSASASVSSTVHGSDQQQQQQQHHQYDQQQEQQNQSMQQNHQQNQQQLQPNQLPHQYKQQVLQQQAQPQQPQQQSQKQEQYQHHQQQQQQQPQHSALGYGTPVDATRQHNTPEHQQHNTTVSHKCTDKNVLRPANEVKQKINPDILVGSVTTRPSPSDHAHHPEPTQTPTLFSPSSDPFLSSFSPMTFTMSPFSVTTMSTMTTTTSTTPQSGCCMPPLSTMDTTTSMTPQPESYFLNQGRDQFVPYPETGEKLRTTDCYASSLPSTESQLFEG